MMYSHEYDGMGNHRIIARDDSTRLIEYEGLWTSYHNVALMSIKGRIYMAVSPYFAGEPGLLPDKVYELIPLESDNELKLANNWSL